jgi:6-phosphofructokinase 1
LIPEQPFDLDELCDRLRHRHARGASFSIIVVAEGAEPVAGSMTLGGGATDEFGHVRLGGIGNALAPEIEDRTGYETRVTTLGHVLRGGTPTAFDRILATRFGLEAIDAAHERDFATMVALRGTDIVRVPIADGVRELKTVPPALLESAAVFFG